MVMSETRPSIAVKPGSAFSRPLDLGPIPPRLVKREAAPRRTKIWEFDTNLHCSIIGTCLSTVELRQVLKKLGVASHGCTDHDLHGLAVGLAGRHDDAARQLHKALDRRHKLAISQFARASTENAVRTLWRDAVSRGEIPGAYWATLTHPLTTQAILREAFGEVHMLSHLVGSANRADIKRLCQLEAEKAGLEAKLNRQQQALHQAVVARDGQIRQLRQALAQQIVSQSVTDDPADHAALHGLIADRERRLAVETRRRIALEERLSTMRADCDRERAARTMAQRLGAALQHEMDVVEASLVGPQGDAPAVRLDGMVLLYVGGRPNQVTHMRAVVEHLGAVFLHHDGGIENHRNLLPAMASRCDCALFPVDCISHDAANLVKTCCRQLGKRFIPLRSASVTSLLAALRAPEVKAIAEAAD